MKKTRTKITNTRRGPFSNKEKAEIAEFLETGKSLEELSLILNRSVKQLTEYCKNLNPNKSTPMRRTEDEELTIELHSQADWKMLQKEYTSTELAFFEIEYVSYRKQFKDLTKTEIKQLHQLIMLDVKIHRHNEDLMRDQKDIDRMDKLLKQLYQENEGNPMNLNNPNMMAIAELETQRQACRSGKNARGKEAKDLLDKHSSILKDLKSTREQRIKNLDDQGKFIGLLKQLENEERRKSIAEITGLMDLAVEKETDRLLQPHKYLDGMIDLPLLIPNKNREMVEVEHEN